MSVKGTLTALADAIRSKTGETGTMTLAQMPSKISGIRIDGSIQGAKSKTITENGTTVIAPDAGYAGIQKATAVVNVTPKLQSKKAAPGKDESYLLPDSGYDGISAVTVLGDANLVAENIRKGVSIFGVIGTYEGYEAASLNNAADAADVLEGKEIMLPDGTAATGTYQPPQSASTEAADATISYEYDPETDTLTIVQTPPLTD